MHAIHRLQSEEYWQGWLIVFSFPSWDPILVDTVDTT